ncbi:MAG TPA: nicotinate-nucleotide adenylyltransferase [Pirellulaceae bacterium]|nr:nicotinate-nucleotide adenylyltransferase [Pirellulaceae bacterium]
MRIGIFGGSFDPIHIGHLIIAEQSREHAQLDEVWFIPAAVAPHKQTGATATGKQRLEMLQLAVAGHESFRVLDDELRRGEVSFTVDTLRSFRAQYPDHEWFLIIGGDSAAQLATWREPAEICRLATPLVYFRPGEVADFSPLANLVSPERLADIAAHRVSGPMIELSSTLVRERLASGRTVRYLVPRAVEKYIETQDLYRPDDG